MKCSSCDQKAPIKIPHLTYNTIVKPVRGFMLSNIQVLSILEKLKKTNFDIWENSKKIFIFYHWVSFSPYTQGSIMGTSFGLLCQSFEPASDIGSV